MIISIRCFPFLLAAAFVAAAFASPSEEQAAAPRPAKSLGNVWCLGDSWSVCFKGETWRRPLCQQLREDGWEFDFVGTLSTDPGCAGDDYDRDHNAIGGLTAKRLREEFLDDWLASIDPDVVLLLIGGNDIVINPNQPAKALGDLRGIVDRIREKNSHVIVHLGMYGYVDVNVPDSGADIMAVALRGLAMSLSTDESPVFFVDHRQGWDKAVHLDPDDKFHPTPEGQRHMAEGWFESITAHPPIKR